MLWGILATFMHSFRLDGHQMGLQLPPLSKEIHIQWLYSQIFGPDPQRDGYVEQCILSPEQTQRWKAAEMHQSTKVQARYFQVPSEIKLLVVHLGMLQYPGVCRAGCGQVAWAQFALLTPQVPHFQPFLALCRELVIFGCKLQWCEIIKAGHTCVCFVRGK